MPRTAPPALPYEAALPHEPFLPYEAVLPYEAAARLCASAARTLLVPRVSSATVLGTGPAVAAHLAALVREVPGLCNITVHPGPARWPHPGAAALAAAQGTALTTAASRERALLGADLVVLAGPALPVDRSLLAPSAVVIESPPPGA
ncbi:MULTISPECIES: hypothetical protein [unclassified Streptomyces]|uniref:hypothetical protein n=1 Tax=unclassified Streptomyces TaxID=2593676 RepID=UPI0004CAA6C5|nr:hypothetical protein [Streptomyces sp. NRRL F-2747]